MDEFIRLDYETIDGLVDAHEGHSAQWAPTFMNHPDTWRMLFSEPERIAGYWHFAPLFPDDYEMAKQGILRDSEITADRVQLFEFPGWYDIYFVQICLLPRYRNRTNIQKLFDSVFHVIAGLATDKIFVREICANAYTEVGRSLCKSFRLQYLKEHRDHGWVYGGTMMDALNAPVTSRFKQLLEYYKKER